jgi:hypothetical protein
MVKFECRGPGDSPVKVAQEISPPADLVIPTKDVERPPILNHGVLAAAGGGDSILREQHTLPVIVLGLVDPHIVAEVGREGAVATAKNVDIALENGTSGVAPGRRLCSGWL